MAMSHHDQYTVQHLPMRVDRTGTSRRHLRWRKEKATKAREKEKGPKARVKDDKYRRVERTQAYTAHALVHAACVDKGTQKCGMQAKLWAMLHMRNG